MKRKNESASKVLAKSFIKGVVGWKGRCPRCGLVHTCWPFENMRFVCQCGYHMHEADFHKP